MESIMKIYAFDLEDELYKPENALKWLNIPYTTITDMDNIPNCPNDIIIASPKQFKAQKDNWDEEQLERAMKILSPKFKKVIMFNDDYTGNSGIAEGFPFKSNNVYMLGLEKRVNKKTINKKTKGAQYRKLLKTNWNFNYVHCRTYYDYPNTDKPNKDKKRSKMYINLNRVPKPHRIRLMMRLMENNLLDNGYNSLMSFPLGVQKINRLLLDDRKERNSAEKYSNKFPKENKESIRKINKLLPMTVDFTKPGGSGFAFGSALSGPSKFTNDSYFSIVTESHYREWGGFLSSEKIMKPLISMQPFFVLGQPYTLKYLQDCGFKTFGNIIDESYDNEVDDIKRFNMVTNEIIKLFTKNTLDEIHDIYYSVFDILEHNRNHLETYCQKELQIIQDIIDDKL
jgi:hypothetical protein|tara:strand:+ start:374 stop:1567 length:1194 start_codon:yes stop_codon:yes gene_type:complete